MNITFPDEFKGTQRFIVERRIGAGGMGVVYLAHDQERNKPVAIKTLSHVDAAALYRFKREFRALADVAHPNLIALYELLFDSGQWFFSMEYVEGSDFVTYVRSGPDLCRSVAGQEQFDGNRAAPPFLPSSISTIESVGELTEDSQQPSSSQSLEKAAGGPGQTAPALISPTQWVRLRQALRQLVEGVLALHEKGILHRDIKPSNVLVTDEGRVILLDFGVATDLQQQGADLTTIHAPVGTIPYMSPEQAACQTLSPASDWYGVGALLYEALTLRRPFQGGLSQILLDKQRIEPRAPGEIVPDVPEDLSALCVELLRRDPGSRPSGAEILRRLGSEGSDDQPLFPFSPTHPPPFVGRRQQLGVLCEAFSSVRAGQPTAVSVSGRSGVGKSSLVERFLRGISDHSRTVVLAGRCYERESVPYKALDSLIDALSHYLVGLPRLEADVLLPHDVASLARLFPVLRRVEAVAEAHRLVCDIPDRQELRDRAFKALRELLIRLGDRKHVVLVIDDLQWGDLDSVALLRELLQPPDSPVLLLIVCYRSEERNSSPVLQAMFEPRAASGRSLTFREIVLDRLSHAEARQLAQILSDAYGPSNQWSCEAIARESGGYPYFIDALVRYRQSTGSSPGLGPPVEGTTLDEALWARVSTLPEPARRLLEVVSVAGHPLCQMDACQAAELSLTEYETIDVLNAAHLARTTGAKLEDEIEVFHDHIRETVAAHLAPRQLIDWHRRLAMVLEDSGRLDAAILAEHFLAAGDCLKAAGYYSVAAEKAADALAFERAARLYSLAIEHGDATDTRQQELRRRRADALANAGRGADAAREYQALADEIGEPAALELRRLAGMHFLTTGHVDEGLAVLQTVLAAAGIKYPKTPRRALFSLILRQATIRLRGLSFRRRDAAQILPADLSRIDTCWSAGVGLSLVDPIRAANFHATGLLMSLRSGEPYRIVRSLVMEATHASAAGQCARSRVRRLISKASDLCMQVKDDHAAALVQLCRGVTACLQGDWRGTVEFCGKAETVLRDRCVGVAWELNTAQGFPFVALYWLGEIAEMGRRAPILMSEAQKRGNLYALANVGAFTDPLLAADNPDEAERQLQDCMGSWSRSGIHLQHFYEVVGRAQIALYRGDAAQAWNELNQSWSGLAGSLLMRVQNIRVTLNEMRARCALAALATTSDPKTLLQAAAQYARKLDHEKTSWAGALAMLLHAEVMAIRGDSIAAARLLQEAIVKLEANHMMLYAASARRRLGQLRGGDDGSRLVAAADLWMAGQMIRNPARMATLYTPGFAS